jgi:hypothetical protein
MIGGPCDGFASLEFEFEYGEFAGLNIVVQSHSRYSFESSVKMEWTNLELGSDRLKGQSVPEVFVYVVADFLD